MGGCKLRLCGEVLWETLLGFILGWLGDAKRGFTRVNCGGAADHANAFLVDTVEVPPQFAYDRGRGR